MELGKNCCFSVLPSDFTITCIIVALTIVLLRVLYVIHQSGKPLRRRAADQPLNTLIVLGSGGHTAEMLNVFSALGKDRFTPRVYIAAATDNMSLLKARTMETSIAERSGIREISARFMQI